MPGPCVVVLPAPDRRYEAKLGVILWHGYVCTGYHWVFLWPNSITSAWSIQVHCLLQIIVNRVSVLLPPSAKVRLVLGIAACANPKLKKIKLLVAGLWTVMCISGSSVFQSCCVYQPIDQLEVYCIWIPAQLNVSPVFGKINFYWTRIEVICFFISVSPESDSLVTNTRKQYISSLILRLIIILSVPSRHDWFNTVYVVSLTSVAHSYRIISY